MIQAATEADLRFCFDTSQAACSSNRGLSLRVSLLTSWQESKISLEWLCRVVHTRATELVLTLSDGSDP